MLAVADAAAGAADDLRRRIERADPQARREAESDAGRRLAAVGRPGPARGRGPPLVRGGRPRWGRSACPRWTCGSGFADAGNDDPAEHQPAGLRPAGARDSGRASTVRSWSCPRATEAARAGASTTLTADRRRRRGDAAAGLDAGRRRCHHAGVPDVGAAGRGDQRPGAPAARRTSCRRSSATGRRTRRRGRPRRSSTSPTAVGDRLPLFVCVVVGLSALLLLAGVPVDADPAEGGGAQPAQHRRLASA